MNTCLSEKIVAGKDRIWKDTFMALDHVDSRNIDKPKCASRDEGSILLGIDTKELQDMSAALLTAACISSSYQVESSKAVSKMWSDIRSNVIIKSDSDFITAVLTTGRIIDLQAEQIEPEEINTILSSFSERIEDLGISPGTNSDLGAAFITTAIISHSAEVETITSIVNTWMELREKLDIADYIDLASAILTTAHILDLRMDIRSASEIDEMLTNLKKEMDGVTLDSLGGREMAVLQLAVAFVELTPKVEKLRDIVRIWSELRQNIEINDDMDVIAVLLLSGKVRDFDMSTLFHSSSAAEQITFLRKALEKL